MSAAINPREYLSGSSSAVYAPIPVYFDPHSGQYVPLRIQPGDPLISGCTCASLGKDCKPHKKCRCEGRVEADGTDSCDYTLCKPCKKDPHGCVVRAGCECRRNALPIHEFVCNELCHAQRGPACGHKVSDNVNLLSDKEWTYLFTAYAHPSREKHCNSAARQCWIR